MNFPTYLRRRNETSGKIILARRRVSGDVPGIGDERTEGERRRGRMKTVLVIMLLKVSVGNGCEIHVRGRLASCWSLPALITVLIPALTWPAPTTSSAVESCQSGHSHRTSHLYPAFVCSRSGKMTDIFTGCKPAPRYGQIN